MTIPPVEGPPELPPLQSVAAYPRDYGQDAVARGYALNAYPRDYGQDALPRDYVPQPPAGGTIWDDGGTIWDDGQTIWDEGI